MRGHRGPPRAGPDFSPCGLRVAKQIASRRVVGPVAEWCRSPSGGSRFASTLIYAVCGQGNDGTSETRRQGVLRPLSFLSFRSSGARVSRGSVTMFTIVVRNISTYILSIAFFLPARVPIYSPRPSNPQTRWKMTLFMIKTLYFAQV